MLSPARVGYCRRLLAKLINAHIICRPRGHMEGQMEVKLGPSVMQCMSAGTDRAQTPCSMTFSVMKMYVHAYPNMEACRPMHSKLPNSPNRQTCRCDCKLQTLSFCSALIPGGKIHICCMCGCEPTALTMFYVVVASW